MEDAQEQTAQVDRLDDPVQDVMAHDAEWKVGCHVLDTFTKIVNEPVPEFPSSRS
jgi:hypothetical protein